MIPSITPPTDNLYKFISLFGLTILLFSVYNVGIAYDSSTKNKMSIEDVKVELQEALLHKSKLTVDSLKTDKVSSHFQPGKIQKMEQDLLKIEQFIERCQLDPEKEIYLSGKISKISVALDNLYLKQCGYIAFACGGCILMIFGFFKWHHKEQKLRDKILVIEHAIKLLDRKYYKEEQSHQNVVSEVVETIVQQNN